MMNKNSGIFILNHNGQKQQQNNEVFLTKGIAFESAFQCLWVLDSRDYLIREIMPFER